MKDQWGHEVVDSGTQRLRARLAEVELETKKQKGIIFGERKFSEALCNDLRSKLAKVEAQRDEAKRSIRLAIGMVQQGNFDAEDVAYVLEKSLLKLEEQ